MFKKKDPYQVTKFIILSIGDSTPLGSLSTEFQVNSYDDIQAADFSAVSKPRSKKFIVYAKQRVRIYNPNGSAPSPAFFSQAYSNYPVLMQTNFGLGTAGDVSIELLDYSPKTLNTMVETSGTNGDSSTASTGTNISNTVGSSTSETNGFSASVSLADPFGASGSYDHSTTETTDKSRTLGSDTSSSRETNSSENDSMSVKDWGSYACVNPFKSCPAWTFGQEYPWNAISCRTTDDTTNPNNPAQQTIAIPQSMVNRLVDANSFLYPPSQLSQFGFDFVMKCVWLFELPDDSPDEITITSTINYFTGSHNLVSLSTGHGADAFIDKDPAVLQGVNGEALSTTINLRVMALDPIGLRNNGAIVGFLPNKFIVQPAISTGAAAPQQFKTIAQANNLLVIDSSVYPETNTAGYGFSVSETSLQANMTAHCDNLQMTLYFKITDVTENYTLYLKHWKTGQTGLILTIVINGDADNTLVKYVDALEAEGGENNLSAISLRNLDYSSVSFHDFLQMGLNSIQISITPIGGTYVAGTGYQLRAISIE